MFCDEEKFTRIFVMLPSEARNQYRYKVDFDFALFKLQRSLSTLKYVFVCNCFVETLETSISPNCRTRWRS